MANRGSESFALEFAKELQATTMSIDRSGEFALLAGRKYLAVLTLDDTSPDKLITRIAYGGKYEIANTQWSKGDDKLMAIASSQRCDIFELRDSSELKCTLRLKGHTRVITDLDWSLLCPSLLASSSFDSYVHIWDIRQKAVVDKPQFSLAALDGASQVRWNRDQPDILASCDGGHVKIWDLRKPSAPAEFIAAHASKINGLEWANADTVITAAQDCTVKFSKISPTTATTVEKTKGPILSLTAPVWRARPAPFGRGVVTQCVPILRRDSGLLSLWDAKRFASPIFTFQAYDIIEFAWKKKQAGNYDLITWSRDQTLRVWTLPREIVSLCGGDDPDGINLMSTSQDDDLSPYNFDPNVDIIDEDDEEDSPPNSTSPPTATSTPIPLKNKRTATLERRSRKSSSPSPLNRRDLLRAEFEKVDQEKPENINFDQVELDKGLLRFSWSMNLKGPSGERERDHANKGRGVTAGILASFPNGYPAAPPTFLVTNASREVDKNYVVKSLKNVAQQFAKKNEQCLLSCVEQFSTIMNSIKTLEDVEQGYFPNARSVSNVPFPRTSGARFCAVGMLVCFGRPSYLRRVKSNMDIGTPRALSALGPYLSQVALENEDSSSSSRHRGKGHSRRQNSEKKTRAGLVTLFDVSPLLPFNLQLATDYTHLISNQKDRKIACENNFNIANIHKKQHVANIWQAAAIISSFAHPEEKKPSDSQIAIHLHDASGDDDEESANWLAYHPLGAELIHSMITHSAAYGDVQTAATLSGIFTSPEHLPSLSSLEGSSTPYKGGRQHRQTVPGVGSPYHTVHAADTLHGHGVMISPLLTAESLFRQHRSNSWSDSLDDINLKTLQLLQQQERENAENHYHHHHHGHHHPRHVSESSALPIGSTSLYHNNNSIVSAAREIPIAKPLIQVQRGILLDYSLHRFYDRYKRSYAEILYRWGLLQQRAQILKNLTEISESNTITRMGVDFTIICRGCGQPSKSPYCAICKRICSICSVCHTPAKGLSTFCPLCGHGGHAQHIATWFSRRKMCATGCGCNCITEVNNRL